MFDSAPSLAPGKGLAAFGYQAHEYLISGTASGQPGAGGTLPQGGGMSPMTFLIGAAIFAGLGYAAPPAFMAHFTVFVLACFVGYMVVWNVTASLTDTRSGTG